MTQSSLRPPSNLQPRPKAVPTFSNTSKGPSPILTRPQLSRSSSQNRQLSPARISGASHVSDKATAALIRRVLCPHVHAGIDPRPINEILPPLTSSNDIDLQLYAIIAIVVKDLVQSWYGKITPDQGFVEEVVRIVAHCTTQLESRIRTVDLEGLVFDELPELVEAHIKGQQSIWTCILAWLIPPNSIPSRSPSNTFIAVIRQSTGHISQRNPTSSPRTRSRSLESLNCRGTAEARSSIQAAFDTRCTSCTVTYGGS